MRSPWVRAADNAGARGGANAADLAAGPVERGVCAIAGAAVLASLALLVHPWYEPESDAALYIATARSIATGEGYAYLGIPFVVRPPGFSLLIAPVVGTGGTPFFALNLLVSLFGAVTVALLFLLERPRLGWALALLTALALWLNPGFQRLCTTAISDVPGVAAALACLLLSRWSDRRPSARREVALGFACGLAAYLRMSNLLLLPAIALARWLREPGLASEPRRAARHLLLFGLVAGAVVAPWPVRNALVRTPPPADQTRLYSYATAMLHVDPGDPSSRRFTAPEIARRVGWRARQIAAVLGGRLRTRVRFSSDDPASVRRGDAAWRWGSPWNLYALGLVAALGVRALRRRDEGALFALGTLALLLLYFGFQDRLLLPVYVIALPAAVALLRDGAARVAGARAGAPLAAAALCAQIVLDFAPRDGWEAIERRHRQLLGTASEIAAGVDPDARLAAVRGFHLSVLLERPVYSLHRAVRRARSGSAIEPVIDEYGLDTVALAFPSVERYLIEEYLQDRYGPPRRSGDARIWRVRPR